VNDPRLTNFVPKSRQPTNPIPQTVHPLTRIVAANKATAHLQSGASSGSTSLQFAYAMLEMIYNATTPAPLNPLTISVQSGFLKRDIYVVLPAYLYKQPAGPPSGPSSNVFTLNFLRTNQIVGQLPLDLSGTTRNAFIGNGSPTSEVAGTYSVAFGEPTCQLYNPEVNTLAATPPTSADNLLLTIIAADASTYNIYLPRTLCMDLDIDTLSITCPAVDLPPNTEQTFVENVVFLACKSYPTIGLTEGTPT